MSVSRVNDPAHFIHTHELASANSMDLRDQLNESLRKLLALLTIGEGDFLFHGESHTQWYWATLVDLVKDALDAQEGLEALIKMNNTRKGDATHV